MKVRPRNGGTARLIWTSVQDLGAGKVMGKGGAASDCSAMFKEAEDEQYIQDCVLEFENIYFMSVLLVLSSCSIIVVLVDQRSFHKPNISSGEHLPHWYQIGIE
jgi:hypothetical protein